MKHYILTKMNHILSWSCKCTDEFVLGNKVHNVLKRCLGRFISCVLKLSEQLHWKKKSVGIIYTQKVLENVAFKFKEMSNTELIKFE